MAKIPTAQELGNKLYQPIGMSCNEFAIKLAIEFAKLHVKAALKAASEEANTQEIGRGFTAETVVDKDSILNAYPESNIK
jgi:hypothetical protein